MANEVDTHHQAAIDRQLQQFFNHLTGVEQRREVRTPFPVVLIAFVMNELHLSGLTRLALIGSKLPVRLCDEDVINLVECLIGANIQLEELHLLHHNITDSGLEEICRLLDKGLFPNTQHQGLSILDLTGNEINGDCIENTLLVSKYDCPLVTLNVSSNPITNQGHLMLAYMCRMNTRLRRLIINSCAFDLGGLNTLLSALANNQTLETLSLDRPLLPNVKEGGIIEHFSKILPTNRSLAHLSLKNHTLYDQQAIYLADALFINDRMISLNLESNRIGKTLLQFLALFVLFVAIVAIVVQVLLEPSRWRRAYSNRARGRCSTLDSHTTTYATTELLL